MDDRAPYEAVTITIFRGEPSRTTEQFSFVPDTRDGSPSLCGWCITDKEGRHLAYWDGMSHRKSPNDRPAFVPQCVIDVARYALRSRPLGLDLDAPSGARDQPDGADADEGREQ